MGMPDMEAKAMLKELQSYSGTGEQNTRALQGQMKSDVMKYLEQEGLGSGRLNTITFPVATGWKSFKAGGAEIGGSVATNAGAVKDFLGSALTNTRYGSLTDGAEPNSFNDFEGMGGPESRSGGYEVRSSLGEQVKGMFNANPFGKAVNGMYEFVSDPTGKMGASQFITSNVKHVDALNELARNGDRDARIATNPNSSREDRAAAIDRLNADKKLGDPLTSGRKNRFVDQVLSSETSLVDPVVNSTKADKLRKGLSDSIGKNVNMLEGVGILEAARRVATGQGDESSRATLRSVYGKDLDNTALMFKAQEVYKKSAENEVVHLPGMLNGKSPEELERAARSGDIKEFGEYAGEIKKKIGDIESSNLSQDKKTSQISDAITLFRSKATGMPLSAIYDKKILAEGVSADTLNNGLEGSRDIASKKLQLGTLAAQKVINFDTKYSSIAALDMKEAVDNFGDFVKKLDSVANKFAGGLPSAPASPMAAHGPVGRFFGWGERDKLQTTGGQ